MAGQQGNDPVSRLVGDDDGGILRLAFRIGGYRAHGDARRAHEHQGVRIGEAPLRPRGKRLLAFPETPGDVRLGVTRQAGGEALRLLKALLGERDELDSHGRTTIVAK